MSRAIHRRLSLLEARLRKPAIGAERIVIPPGWHQVGRGFLVPPVMSEDEWEATVPAEQAALKTGEVP